MEWIDRLEILDERRIRIKLECLRHADVIGTPRASGAWWPELSGHR
jgi:hypothetical protein